MTPRTRSSHTVQDITHLTPRTRTEHIISTHAESKKKTGFGLRKGHSKLHLADAVRITEPGGVPVREMCNEDAKEVGHIAMGRIMKVKHYPIQLGVHNWFELIDGGFVLASHGDHLHMDKILVEEEVVVGGGRDGVKVLTPRTFDRPWLTKNVVEEGKRDGVISTKFNNFCRNQEEEKFLLADSFSKQRSDHGKSKYFSYGGHPNPGPTSGCLCIGSTQPSHHSDFEIDVPRTGPPPEACLCLSSSFPPSPRVDEDDYFDLNEEMGRGRYVQDPNATRRF